MNQVLLDQVEWMTKMIPVTDQARSMLVVISVRLTVALWQCNSVYKIILNCLYMPRPIEGGIEQS